MAEEKKPGAAAVFLAKHWEKLVLVLAAGALLAYLVFGRALAARDVMTERLKAKIAATAAEIEKEHDDQKPPAAKEWVIEALGPWSEVITAEPSKNDWTASAPPIVAYRTYPKPPVALRGVEIPRMTLGAADVGLDGVTLNWSVSGFTAADLTKLKQKNEILRFARFSVEREVAGSGKWEVLKEDLTPPAPPKGARDVPAYNMSYRDTRIDPKTKYNYRVTAFLDLEEIKRLDPKKVELKNIDRTTGKHQVAATTEPVTTLGIWKLSFSNPMKGMAYIEIEKFEKSIGKPAKVRLIQYAGDPIGAKNKGTKEEPVWDDEHAVHIPGIPSMMKVKFNTGMVLLKVEPMRLTIEVPRCKPRIEGSPPVKVGCDRVVDKVPFETHEIVYKDEEGREVKFLLPDPKDPKFTYLQPQLCEEHGGRPRTAPEPPPKGEKK